MLLGLTDPGAPRRNRVGNREMPGPPRCAPPSGVKCPGPASQSIARGTLDAAEAAHYNGVPHEGGPIMPSRNPLDPIPHPPRTPWLGNLLSLGATSPVQNMAKLARQYWPIYWLDMRGKPLVIVSGHELVDELCDESRFDKSVRGALRARAEVRGRRPLHRVHAGAELVEGAQHPAAELQPARDAGLPRDDARHRRAARPEVGAAQRRRRGRRRARHDLADPRHDRAVRLRLPLQLVLPRDESPLRRRHRWARSAAPWSNRGGCPSRI